MGYSRSGLVVVEVSDWAIVEVSGWALVESESVGHSRSEEWELF